MASMKGSVRPRPNEVTMSSQTRGTCGILSVQSMVSTIETRYAGRSASLRVASPRPYVDGSRGWGAERRREEHDLLLKCMPWDKFSEETHGKRSITTKNRRVWDYLRDTRAPQTHRECGTRDRLRSESGREWVRGEHVRAAPIDSLGAVSYSSGNSRVAWATGQTGQLRLRPPGSNSSTP